MMISGGLGLKQGLGFPGRDWGQVMGVKAQGLSPRPVVSDKGLGPSALQKRIFMKTESSEASISWEGKKVRYTWIDTWVDSETESMSRTVVGI